MRSFLPFLILILCAQISEAQTFLYSTVYKDTAGNREVTVYDRNGKAVFDHTWKWAYFNYWNWLITYNGDSLEIHDTLGNSFNIAGVQDVHNIWVNSKYIPILVDSLWGYYTREGKCVVQHRFNDITLFEDDLAAVVIGADTFFIDTLGKILDRPYVQRDKYEFVQMESAVGMTTFHNYPQETFEHNGLVGLRDSKTKEVMIPAQYKGLYNIMPNRLIAELDDKYGVVDFNNNIIIPIEHQMIYVLEGD